MSRMKSRPASAATGSVVIPVFLFGNSSDLSAKSGPLPRKAFRAYAIARYLLYTAAAPCMAYTASHVWPAPPIMTESHRHPLCALADRLPPHRRRPHRAVQLALCARSAAARCCCGSRTPTASARPSRAIAAILDGLKWLELDWDGDVIYQFSRAARHREVAEAAAGQRQGLSLLRHPGRTHGDARKGPRRGPHAAL